MSSATIKADLRPKLGSTEARRLRATGRIPATIQGGGGEHLDVSLDLREFVNARRHHAHLFDIEVGGRTESATVRELQWTVLGDSISHVEFRRVRRDEKTEVSVLLEFVGHPKDGVLNHLLGELEVRCLPSMIPDSIEVKVDDMVMGQPLLARDIPLPEGLELATAPATPVAVVAAARGLDEPTPAEPAGGAAPAEAPKPSGDAS